MIVKYDKNKKQNTLHILLRDADGYEIISIGVVNKEVVFQVKYLTAQTPTSVSDVENVEPMSYVVELSSHDLAVAFAHRSVSVIQSTYGNNVDILRNCATCLTAEEIAQSKIEFFGDGDPVDLTRDVLLTHVRYYAKGESTQMRTRSPKTKPFQRADYKYKR